MLLQFLILILTVLGVAVSLWPPKERAKFVWFACIVLIGCAAMVLQYFDTRNSEATARKLALGDQTNPPYLALLPGADDIHILIYNDADYPVPALQIRLWDPMDYTNVGRLTLEEVIARSLMLREFENLPPHSATVVGTLPLPRDRARQLEATIVSSLGQWDQQIRLMLVGEKWSIVSRITKDRTQWIIKADDPRFPRTANGEIEW